MKYFWRYFFCALLLLTSWQVSLCQLPAKPSQKPLNQPGEDTDFQRYLSSGRISVVAFYADWCPSCRSWDPVLEAVNDNFPDMQVLFIDIGEWDTPVTEKYGFQSIPHFKIYDGAGRFIVEGSAAKSWLRQAIARRLEAKVRSNYRFGGERLNLTNATGSVTTKPRSGRPTTAVRTAARSTSREKIESTGPLPTVEQVLDRYMTAVGGATTAAKFSTRSAKGKVHISTIGRGSFVTYAKAPNKVALTIDIPEAGEIKQGFNGAAAWSQGGRSGVRAATEIALATLKRDFDFHGWTALKARYPKMRLLGVAKIGFRETYVVEAQPKLGEPEKLYFSKDNGLIIRWDGVRTVFGVRTLAETYLDDWTEVDGIKLPFTVTQSSPRLSVVFSFNEVRHDIPISDAVFNRPVTR